MSPARVACEGPSNRSTMARTLEALAAGTPVYCGSQRVGEVSALYAEGSSRAVEWVVTHWTTRGADVAVPATEVESVSDSGVVLMHADPQFYNELATFAETRFPTARRLA